ncbi:hypothetical protein AKJ51_02595 [candidate division MSBL1 archaeon SCGC-AAA382A20]|uniref:Uncharacterized protein n=1 Tax=candidate division MSBL1 archaeon SCGC-AAA382A20 TaxID=1698280 RepID=A0A133VKB0_9EURY|nr:hypothetical protein AKJ51_02595 [candidate division MSBL1 archaeon SCGC-AAA382A20]
MLVFHFFPIFFIKENRYVFNLVVFIGESMYPRLKKYEVNHIKTSLERCSAQGLADELGRAKETIERKISEIREGERIENISRYASKKKSKLKTERLKKVKLRIQRKIKGGM